jgi:hypothetical protein
MGVTEMEKSLFVCLFVCFNAARRARGLTVSFSQPHFSRMFLNRRATMDSYWLPRQAECVYLALHLPDHSIPDPCFPEEVEYLVSSPVEVHTWKKADIGNIIYFLI